VAQALDVPMGWIHQRIYQGAIQIEKDLKTQRFLFPDDPETLMQLKQLRDGHIEQIAFAKGYQDD
jgi:hypothetical protein